MLKDYILAIWQPWLGKMSGIASLCFTIAATYSTFFTGNKGLAHAKVYLWAAAAFCFLAANYVAWEAKARRVKELEAQLSDNHPKLLIGLGSLIWRYDAALDMTLFFFGAEMINQGGPTITTGWSAMYTLGSSTEPMQSFYLHTPYRVTVGTETLTVATADLLNVKTQSDQIERGGHKGGRLLFTLSGDRTAQLKTAQFRVDVTCHDYLFSPHTGTYTPSPQPVGSLQFLPTEQVSVESSPLLRLPIIAPPK